MTKKTTYSKSGSKKGASKRTKTKGSASKSAKSAGTKIAGSKSSQVSARKRSSIGSIIQYVLPVGNGWVVKSNNAAKYLVITDSKKEAVDIARKLAQTRKTGLIVHGRSGNIEVKENYAVAAS